MRKIGTSALIASLLLGAPVLAQTTDTAPVPGVTGNVTGGTSGAVDGAVGGATSGLSGTAGATAGAMADIAAPEGYSAVTDWTTVTADQLEGIDLRHGTDDASVGTVADVELGADGQVSGVIVDVGGFLGIGAHRVKLSTEQVVVFRNAENEIVAYVNADAEALKAMPEYTAPGG